MIKGVCIACCLPALPLASIAAQPEGGRYVYVPPGALRGVADTARPQQAMVAPMDFPVARMIAQQESVMRHMMANMDSLMATLPDPRQMIRSIMDGMPQAVPGSAVVMTSVSSGNGTCSETITYGYPANDGRPRVKVSRTGNACGALMSSGPIGVTQTAPVRGRRFRRQPQRSPENRLWHVSYPARPVAIHTASPRT